MTRALQDLTFSEYLFTMVLEVVKRHSHVCIYLLSFKKLNKLFFHLPFYPHMGGGWGDMTKNIQICIINVSRPQEYVFKIICSLHLQLREVGVKLVLEKMQIWNIYISKISVNIFFSFASPQI